MGASSISTKKRIAPAVEGTPHKKDASILLYADPPISGGFQNWRDGKGWENWTYWNGKEDRAKLTEEEVLAAKARQEKIKKAREQDRAKRQKEAAEEAQQIWEAAGPAEPLHPYLAKKKIEPNGLRMNGDGRLLAAMMDESNTLVNLQKIDARGEKRFHPGGKVAGTFSSFGPAPDPSGTIVIVEGNATGASVFEATGLSVISAMSADNLLAVTKIFRKRFPKAKLIIFADNDTQETHGHTLGVDAAEGAANATGAYIAISSTPGDDANDLYAREGAEAVRASITAARTTEIQDPEMDETGDQAEDIPPKKSDITISRSSPLKTAKSFIKLRLPTRRSTDTPFQRRIILRMDGQVLRCGHRRAHKI
jgi:putative DNA primase/helicase